MTDAWDDEDRAIARALGADAPEPESFGAGANVDDAVIEYEAVLAQLPFSEVAPAPELEDRVVTAALARRPAAARAITGARSERARRASRRWMAAGGAAVAAAAIIVALAVSRPPTGGATPGARIEPAAATETVARVLAEPGTRRAALRAGSGATVGRVALGPGGQGYLYDLRPGGSAPAPGDQWLWLDTGSGSVRVGRMTRGAQVHFVVQGAAGAVNGVFVTTETPGSTPSKPGPVSSRASFPTS